MLDASSGVKVDSPLVRVGDTTGGGRMSFSKSSSSLVSRLGLEVLSKPSSIPTTPIIPPGHKELAFFFSSATSVALDKDSEEP